MQEKAERVKWVVSDMLLFKGSEDFDIWHDRAAFHFLTDTREQQLYLDNVNKSLKENGYLVLSTFSENGPKKCSNLPVKQFSELKLSELISRYFKKITCFTTEHVTPFNTVQQFQHCVFQKYR